MQKTAPSIVVLAVAAALLAGCGGGGGKSSGSTDGTVDADLVDVDEICALIEEHASTTVLMPGDRMTVDAYGNLVIAVGRAK